MFFFLNFLFLPSFFDTVCIYFTTAAERRASFVTATEDEEESDSDMDSEHVRRLGHDHSNPNSQSQGFSQNTEEVR